MYYFINSHMVYVCYEKNKYSNVVVIVFRLEIKQFFFFYFVANAKEERS